MKIIREIFKQIFVITILLLVFSPFIVAYSLSYYKYNVLMHEAKFTYGFTKKEFDNIVYYSYTVDNVLYEGSKKHKTPSKLEIPNGKYIVVYAKNHPEISSIVFLHMINKNTDLSNIDIKDINSYFLGFSTSSSTVKFLTLDIPYPEVLDDIFYDTFCEN